MVKPMSDFDEAFSALIGNEGGYSNNLADPGGETMYGITVAVARANGYTGPMQNLPMETAKQIAKGRYWYSVHADVMSDKLAFQMFDAAYNSGPSQSIKWLQTALGVDSDGVVGPVTLNALQNAQEDSVIMKFNSARLTFLTGLNTWTTFGKGWARRIADNLVRGAS
jgi:lysozyme family protein